MELNIYGKIDGKKAVVKTYKAETYDLMFGTVEDVANAVNLDSLKTGSNAEIIRIVGNLVINSMDTVKDLLRDVFEGITNEELKNTKVAEIAVVLIEIVKYTMAQMSLGRSGKN